MSCGWCGGRFEPGSWNARYCSESCRNRAAWVSRKAKSPCPECGGPKSPDGQAARCWKCAGLGAPVTGGSRDGHCFSTAYRAGCRCDECKRYNTERGREYRARRAAQGHPTYRFGPFRPCAYCGGDFQAKASRKFCSLDCYVRSQGGEVGNPKRPATRYWISDSARDAIFEAANYVCALCDEPMRLDLEPLHDLYPTLDHIVPRSRGGSDDPSNLQPAHRLCNLRKGASWQPFVPSPLMSALLVSP